MSDIYVMESANLYCGGDGPEASKHLTLDSFKLPTMEEATQEHRPGGGPGAINIALGQNPLEMSFKLVGWDPQTLQLFGLGARRPRVYTALGAVMAKGAGTIHEAKVIVEGRLIRIEPDEFKRGELMGHDHSINEIWHYELWFGDKEMQYFDLRTATWRVGGVDENADTRRILRIPGS